MGELNTAWLLVQWGLWRSEGGGINLRPKGTLAGIVPACARDAERVYSEISDDDALRVDRALAQLNLVSAQWREVLILTCVHDYGDRRVAAYYGITRYAAQQLYMEAYEWIDIELNKKLLIAA